LFTNGIQLIENDDVQTTLVTLLFLLHISTADPA